MSIWTFPDRKFTVFCAIGLRKARQGHAVIGWVAQRNHHSKAVSHTLATKFSTQWSGSKLFRIFAVWLLIKSGKKIEQAIESHLLLGRVQEKHRELYSYHFEWKDVKLPSWRSVIPNTCNKPLCVFRSNISQKRLIKSKSAQFALNNLETFQWTMGRA